MPAPDRAGLDFDLNVPQSAGLDRANLMDLFIWHLSKASLRLAP